MLMVLVLAVAVIGKVVGCGMAALASGMDWVRSLRIGCGMMSRGEVGLIVTAMGAATGIFGRTEVAVMVTVVLLTTLLTPLALRATFGLHSPQDIAEGLAEPGKPKARAIDETASFAAGPERGDTKPREHSSLMSATPQRTGVLTFGSKDAASDLE